MNSPNTDIPYDAWLLALEVAKIELYSGIQYTEFSENYMDDLRGIENIVQMTDFFAEWIFEIRLHRSDSILF